MTPQLEAVQSSLQTPLTPSWATHGGSFPRSDVQAKFVAWAQQRFANLFSNFILSFKSEQSFGKVLRTVNCE